MSTVVQGSFTIVRELAAAPARVFAAFSNLEALRAWFKAPAEWSQKVENDFRVGGSLSSVGGPKGGTLHSFVSRYYDIVDNERIVYAYEMHLDAVRMSVSLATITFEALGPKKTRLTVTEHGAFLDAYHDGNAGREHGTKALLDQLAVAVES